MGMYIVLNDKKYPLEVKYTSKSKSQGMMGRKNLNGGMLFIFNEPENQSFWMKNCLIDLDIVFLNKNRVTKIHHSCIPCNSEDCEHYEGYGNMVLEFKGGFCEENDINEGDQIDFSY